MKLKKLRIYNISSHETFEIDFEKQKYPLLIVGGTASGKTTLIVDGIMAALYAAPYGAKRYEKRWVFPEYVRIDANVGIVELEVEIGQKVIKIRREFDRVKRGERVEYLEFIRGVKRPIRLKRVRETERRIIEHVGMSWDVILSSIITRHQDRYWIYMEPSKIRRLLVRTLGLDFSRLLRAIESELMRIENEIIKAENELRKIHEEVSEERELRIKLEELQSKLSRLEEEKTKIRNEITNKNRILNEKKEKLQFLSKKIAIIERESKKWEQLLRRLKNSFNVENIDKILDISIIEKIKQIPIIARRLEDLELREEQLLKLLEEKQKLTSWEQELKKLPELNKRIKEIENRIVSLREEKEEKSGIIACLNRFALLLEKYDYCPVCGQTLTPDIKKKRPKELREEAKKLKIEVSNLIKSIQRLENERNKLLKEIGALEQLKNQVEELRKRIHTVEDLETKIKEIKREKEELIKIRSEILNMLIGRLKNKETAETVLNKIIRDPSLLGLLEEAVNIADVKYEIEKHKKELKKSKQLKEEIRKLEKKINELNQRLGEIRSNLDNVRNELTEIHRRLSEIEVLKKRLPELEGKIQNLSIEKRAYKLLQKTLSESGFPMSIIRKYVDFLSSKTNEYLKSFGASFQIKLICSEDAIYIRIFTKNAKRPIFTLSNGEKILLELSLRLALAELIEYVYPGITRPKFLILDGILNALDTDTQRKIIHALVYLVEKRKYPQVIVLSHDYSFCNYPEFRSIITLGRTKSSDS